MSGSGICWATCKSAPRSRQDNHASTPPLSFLQAGCPSCRPTNSVKALKALFQQTQFCIIIVSGAGQYEMEGGSARWDAKCTFDFYSSPTSKSGRFFSPRYPQLYPPSSRCLYVFFGLRGERVQITFHNIQLDVPHWARYVRVYLYAWV